MPAGVSLSGQSTRCALVLMWCSHNASYCFLLSALPPGRVILVASALTEVVGHVLEAVCADKVGHLPVALRGGVGEVCVEISQEEWGRFGVAESLEGFREIGEVVKM